MNRNLPLEIVPPQPSSVTPLTVFLCIIMLFFCAVLVFVYTATKRANPIMLDQQGHPMSQTSARTR